MSNIVEVKVPDIGDFKSVAIIEVLVAVGDTVQKDQSLITLESDKATMEVPSSATGIVKELKVKLGDQVSEGSLVLLLETSGTVASKPAPTPVPTAPVSAPKAASAPSDSAEIHAEVLVLGSGPGGYTAAFRAADLGKKVVLVERFSSLGGVCLNVGCIPSKALLHTAAVVTETQEMGKHGVSFAQPMIDLKKLADWKDSVIKRLTSGLTGLAKQRKVQVVTGTGKFTSAHTLQVETAEGVKTISFDTAVIAAGSQPTKIPSFPYHDRRLMDSTDALRLTDVPKKLLVIGGGIIGLEMATVYDALGSEISIVELLGDLITGCDRDIVKPLQKRIEKRYAAIYLNTKVTKIEAVNEGLKVFFEGANAPASMVYDKVLVAVGRKPNGKLIDADKAGVIVNDMGFIPVDKQMRTNIPHIYAIGDVVGNPMLAHKAVHEGKIAAENAAGHKSYFDARTIPSVAYTDPEVAWMGMTETEAKAKGVEYEKGVFPWAASGRALSLGRDEGMTKLLFDRKTKRIIGAGIVGVNAGDLLAETMLAYEMGADVHDLGLTIHAHPTLSETIAFASEVATGEITDLYAPRKTPWV
ncbi:dihydrolipoyl dehydrogenase [Beggiatoa leptomitoformis]|uniref:Dihydrolipoyl dehydrogenase n=1 Tax=Beggiatoa leptomitoformis TaxID=288004 RepID=A0A2N9YB65_9GAMM|nr:dihydrolipoyl dehydrogenase [Beggiatoa leptomitoformis]ALG66949.1 dihydrolipoyl dehydrogenase [Beggiatoa leptomitoformis]AUI67682.1 dihydrolipoyl dehydrogenase [Beggiatoa leptomitoformis]